MGVNFGTIRSSYATGAVSGGFIYVGGLVGNNSGGTISNSYATGTVSGYSYGGGLVGGNTGTISSSYATGAVSGNNYGGGLVGYNYGGTINTSYHMDNRPYFDAIEMKGGGDAVSAARAVLQTGEFDFAWNLQVEDEILQKLEKGGKGKVTITPGGGIEHIQLNTTDPWTEVDGERSSLKTRHPTLSDPAVRQALALLVDKDSVEKFIYGRGGVATANFINNPERFRSKNTKYEFNVD